MRVLWRTEQKGENATIAGVSLDVALYRSINPPLTYHTARVLRDIFEESGSFEKLQAWLEGVETKLTDPARNSIKKALENLMVLRLVSRLEKKTETGDEIYELTPQGRAMAVKRFSPPPPPSDESGLQDFISRFLG